LGNPRERRSLGWAETFNAAAAPRNTAADASPGNPATDAAGDRADPAPGNSAGWAGYRCPRAPSRASATAAGADLTDRV
jgi:hypothetical protein